MAFNCNICSKECDRPGICIDCFKYQMSLLPNCDRCAKKVGKVFVYYIKDKMISACALCMEKDSKLKTFNKDGAYRKKYGIFKGKEFGTMAVRHGKTREDRVPYLRFDYTAAIVGSICIFKGIQAPEENNRTFNGKTIAGKKVKVLTGVYNSEAMTEYFYKDAVYLTDAPFIKLVESSTPVNPMNKRPKYDSTFYCAYVLDGNENKGKFYANYSGFSADTIDEVYQELVSSGVLESINNIWLPTGIQIPAKPHNKDSGLFFLTSPETMGTIEALITDIVESNQSNNRADSSQQNQNPSSTTIKSSGHSSLSSVPNFNDEASHNGGHDDDIPFDSK